MNLHLACLAPALFASALFAQNCTDNLYRLHLVNSVGVEVPNQADPITGIYHYSFTNEDVFLAFDPLIPSGTYYVHVTDPFGNGDEVLSTNDPLDRFVAVQNNAGVISLSLPFTPGTTPPVFGLGLNGVGQSIRIAPFASSLDEPCQWKAWFGDCWDLSLGPSNPYLIMGGFNPATQQCCIRSYADFTIGGASSNDLCGVVFHDENGNGARDVGEAGVGSVTVNLNGGPTSVVTNASGEYCFVGVGQGTFSVGIVVPSGYVATSPTPVQVEINLCADGVANFGIDTPSLPSDGHTPGFWRNNNGTALVTQYGILATLPGLNLVNASGQYVAPATISAWRTWLQGGNATNMAYMLSIHLAAMHCNVVVGFVSPNAMISEPGLGTITIADLMAQAIAELAAHPYTPTGSPFRAHQTLLKNALDHANNNLNWL